MTAETLTVWVVDDDSGQSLLNDLFQTGRLDKITIGGSYQAESRWYRKSGPGHLTQVGPFAAN